jgi:hypothetical protein
MAPIGHADNIIDLDFPTGPYAKSAMNTGIQEHAHGRVTGIRRWSPAGAEAAARKTDLVSPSPKTRIRVMRLVASRLICQQQLEDHGAGVSGPRRNRVYLHSVSGLAHAGCRQHPLTLYLHHAGTAVAIGPITGLVSVAQMRNKGALPLRNVPDTVVFPCLYLDAIQEK